MWITKIFLLISFIFLTAPMVRADDDTEIEEFRPPKSMLETAERLLQNNKEPAKRLEILFRWVKIMEDFETTKRAELKDPNDPRALAGFKRTKLEIIERLLKELKYFEGSPLSIDRMHREIAFRLMEQKRSAEAQSHFEMLSAKTGDDELAYGDALLANKLTEQALQAYSRASQEEKLRTVAAYRKAWAYLTLNDFQNSLVQFDLALEENPHSPSKMREEAFRDRLRPFVETFVKVDFEYADATSLKDLANRIRPALYSEALKFLVDAFNAKNEVRKAQQAFGFLLEALPKNTNEAVNILITASPKWIRIHRGRLEHDDVERILRALPETEIPAATSTELASELNNSAAFYETLVADVREDKSQSQRTRQLLNVIYKKFFQLYPKDAEADPLRINYGRLLLEDGDAEHCLSILSGRSKKDPDVEKLAGGLEAKCDLKHIDQLYARPHDDYFYNKLYRALIEDKIYKRPEIGLPEEPTFKSLVGMLMGSLKKDSKPPMLRKSLTALRDSYPYSKDDPAYREIRVVLSELEFGDLMLAQLESNDKAKLFYAIFETAPEGASVTNKALKNSIILASDKEALARCDKFQTVYSDQFGRGSEVYVRCLGLAERHLQLEKELAYWKLYEAQLDDSQKVRVGLLELALGREGEGRSRLQKLKSGSAQKALDFWYGVSQEKPALSPKIAELEQASLQFVKSLKKVAFIKIGKVVPRVIEEFRGLDKQWVKASKIDSSSLALAKILDNRALISSRMRDWMKSLPEPSDLTPEELKVYREKTSEVIKPWEDLAAQAIKECSESAYALSPDFEKSANCPEATAENTYNEFMRKWENSRQAASAASSPWQESSATEQEKLFGIIYEAGLSDVDTMRARYFLIRAYEMAKQNREKARIQLAMAKILDKERFWLGAAELDGNLTDPILWLKTRANGNPFYERLYDDQLELVRRRDRFSPGRVTSSAQGDAGRF